MFFRVSMKTLASSHRCFLLRRTSIRRFTSSLAKDLNRDRIGELTLVYELFELRHYFAAKGDGVAD